MTQELLIFSIPARARTALVWAAVALAVAALRLALSGPEGFSGIHLSEIQLLAFPLVVFLFWKLRILGKRIPRAVIIPGMIAGVLAIGYSYLYLRDAPLSFVVSYLKGDNFEAGSRQFRQLIATQLRRVTPPRAFAVQRSHETFTSHAEAQKFLARSEHLPVLVWGSLRWITVSFHPERTALPIPKSAAAWISSLKLRLVESAPVVGLTLEPQQATAEFIARLVGATLTYKYGPGTRKSRQWAFDELSYVAHQESHWNSFAHRAYPWWLLGNLHLFEALRDGGVEMGELRCAIEAYTRARKFLRAGDNPELLAAALNNRAIAQSIQSVVSRSKGLRRMVKRGFKAAAFTIKERNLYGVTYRAGKIARANLRMVLAGSLGGRGSLKKARLGNKKRKARGLAQGSGKVGKGKRLKRKGTRKLSAEAKLVQ